MAPRGTNGQFQTPPWVHSPLLAILHEVAVFRSMAGSFHHWLAAYATAEAEARL